jgi:hypothetical protein
MAMIDIPLNARVVDACFEYAHGWSGRSNCILLDPETKQMTHLVVRMNGYRQTERLVPMDWIADTTSAGDHLDGQETKRWTWSGVTSSASISNSNSAAIGVPVARNAGCASHQTYAPSITEPPRFYEWAKKVIEALARFAGKAFREVSAGELVARFTAAVDEKDRNNQRVAKTVERG